MNIQIHILNPCWSSFENCKLIYSWRWRVMLLLLCCCYCHWNMTFVESNRNLNDVARLFVWQLNGVGSELTYIISSLKDSHLSWVIDWLWIGFVATHPGQITNLFAGKWEGGRYACNANLVFPLMFPKASQYAKQYITYLLLSCTYFSFRATMFFKRHHFTVLQIVVWLCSCKWRYVYPLVSLYTLIIFVAHFNFLWINNLHWSLRSKEKSRFFENLPLQSQINLLNSFYT